MKQGMALWRAPSGPSSPRAGPFPKLTGDLLCQPETIIGPFVHMYVEKRAVDVNAGQAQGVMEEVAV